MANVFEYVKNYGPVSFKDKPFTDADNVAMCCSFYMPLEQVVSADFDAEPIPFDEAFDKLFELRGRKHTPVGLVLVKEISMLMEEMSRHKRFAEMKVVGCTDNFGKEPPVQFNAGTFLLPNGDIVVLFRGTDDTLMGWLEDVDILVDDDIPSHHLALEYIAQVAEKFEGDIIVCGHSKGGYMAQYAALNSPKEIRDRIKAVYNNDGPGFSDYDYLNSEAYNEILPRYKHLVPQSSFIGMMLSHDDDYEVVKSNRVTGAMQHDLLSWQVDDDSVKKCEDMTTTGKVTDLVFHDLVSNLTPEESNAFGEVVGSVFEGIDQKGLLDVKNHFSESVRGGAKAWKELDPEVKKTFRKVIRGARKYVLDASRTVLKGEYKTVSERIEEEE